MLQCKCMSRVIGSGTVTTYKQFVRHKRLFFIAFTFYDFLTLLKLAVSPYLG